MVHFYDRLRSTTSYLANRTNALIVGGGIIPQHCKGQHINDLVIAVNLAFLEIQNVDIVIVKNRKTLNEIFRRKALLDQYHWIIPSDIINSNEKELFKNVTWLADTSAWLATGFNPLQNLPVFCLRIAEALGAKKAELAGFSFNTDSYTGSNKTYNQIYFKQQREMLDDYLTKSSLDVTILHTRAEAPRELETVTQVLNRRLMNNETVIVAEFTNNHLGDIEHLLEMVELVSAQGADLVKIQKRDVDAFYTETEKVKPYHSMYGDTLYDYRKGVELSPEEIMMLNDKCERCGIPWFSTVLDWNSYQLLDSIKKQPLIKLPSTISNFKNYLKKVSEEYPEEKDIVISTGATSMEYVNWVLNNFYNGKRRLFLLHTLSAYPTPLEDINVGVINLYKKLQKDYPLLIPGYSGHDIGNFGTQMAVAAGAQMVERHVKLEETEWIHFGPVASNLRNGEFAEYVRAVRQADLMRGKEEKIVHSIEHHKYTPNDKVN